MGERNLKLVADNKPRKRHILLLFACLAVVLGMGIYFLITDFSIQKIQISGNNTYTNAEIIEAMKEDGYIDNTLLMIAQNQIFDQTYLPFNIKQPQKNTYEIKISSDKIVDHTDSHALQRMKSGCDRIQDRACIHILKISKGYSL